MRTHVFDLRTGRWLTFNLPPEKAVVAAYRQSTGNMNWWSPGYWNLPIMRGEHVVTCGDFSAFIDRCPCVA